MQCNRARNDLLWLAIIGVTEQYLVDNITSEMYEGWLFIFQHALRWSISTLGYYAYGGFVLVFSTTA